jgi:hypothetical protein
VGDCFGRPAPVRSALDELRDPGSGDPAQLSDLDAAKLSPADQVIDLVAADVQNLCDLLDRQELMPVSAATCR